MRVCIVSEYCRPWPGGISEHVHHEAEELGGYLATITNQDDVVESPLVETKYAGLLIATNLKKEFGKNKSEYGNDFVFNYSLEDSDNWRWTMDQYVTTSLTEMLALKVSLLWLYNNVPAFQMLDLIDPDALPGDPELEPVLEQLEELDTIFSISLVVNF